MKSPSSRKFTFSRHKLAVLEARRREGGMSRSSISRIKRRLHSDFTPMSFAQQRIWILNQLEPESPAYNFPAAIKIEGPLDHTILDRCMAEIVCRHEALRTVFGLAGDRPAQVVLPSLHLALPLADLSSFSRAEQLARIQAFATEEVFSPFDLARGPLVRLKLVRLAPEEHVLLVTVHHIVSDGWSLNLLTQELAALYCAFSSGRPSPLSDVPVQYADFARWQHNYLSGEVLGRQLTYWKKKLGGSSFVLDLPADRARPAQPTYLGGRYFLGFPKSVVEALKALSRAEGATLFMTLLAAFQTLLHRYTGKTDIIVGSPTAGRNQSEVEPLIGFFLNMLVLRTDLAGDPPFRELLARVRETALGAYAHQEMPFEKLVEALQPERTLSSNPLFQVMFILQNVSVPGIHESNLEVSFLDIDRPAAVCDLTLQLIESADALNGWIEYSSDLFERETIERMAGHLHRLIDAILENPNSRISALSILSEAERRALIAEYNRTSALYPACCVHQLFEEQAARRPKAIAATCAGEAITREELNVRANRLARRLSALGAGPDCPVGICMERSIGMVVALLAILKSGSAYVPLDPAYPKERLEYMIGDALGSSGGLLLTETALAQELPAGGIRTLCVDQEDVAGESPENPEYAARPGNMAYIIYTSGSTGKPKGVCVTHGAVVNFLASMRNAPGLCERDSLLAVTTLSFDIAGLELFLPLSIGARIVLAGRESAVDPALLSRLIDECGITCMQATPATWRMLIDSGWEGGGKLKVLCGGEALSRELADALRPRCASLWNMYGPTETTIWSSVREIDSEAPISIGRPIANTQMYVLDTQFQPVPAGVPGELYIAGDGLARGYLNRPELSAEKFVPNPFGKNGARMYRSGDLARFLPDGTIECLGRIDNQVKIRGFRIELGEIEAAARAHPSVRDAVAVARADNSGEKSLALYVLADTSAADASTQVKALLAEKLPPHMVPAAVVVMSEFPLTPSGKVDRRALPEPQKVHMAAGPEYQAPRTQLEADLAAIWAEVLGLERVGAGDSFFALGGHSLLATQVIARIRKKLNIDLPMRSIFKAPTVAALAELTEKKRREDEEEMNGMVAELENLSSEEAAEKLAESQSVQRSLDR